MAGRSPRRRVKRRSNPGLGWLPAPTDPGSKSQQAGAEQRQRGGLRDWHMRRAQTSRAAAIHVVPGSRPEREDQVADARLRGDARDVESPGTGLVDERIVRPV